MAVTLLEIARIFATKVPGKIDADVLQLLWKVCFGSIIKSKTFNCSALILLSFHSSVCLIIC